MRRYSAARRHKIKGRNEGEKDCPQIRSPKLKSGEGGGRQKLKIFTEKGPKHGVPVWEREEQCTY